MIKRIIILLLIFILLFACSFSVFGSELDYNESVSMCDFLSTDKFNLTCAASGNGEGINELYFTTTTDDYYFDQIDYDIGDEGNTVSYNELELIEVNWRPLTISYSKKLYFYFTTVDATFTVKINGTEYPLGFAHASTLYRAYYLSLPKTLLIQEITVRIESNEGTFNSVPGIVSCFGSNTLVNDISSGWISGFDYVWYDTYSDQEWSDLISVKKENYMSERLFVPGEELDNTNYYISDNDYYEDGYSVLTSNVTIVVDLTKIGPDYLDFFSMNYETIGSVLQISSFVFSDFDDRADSALVSIPIHNTFADISDFELLFPDAEITEVDADGYSCFVDLSSIDIKTYKYLSIGIAIDPIATNREYNTFSFLGVRAMRCGYTLEHDTFETRLLFNVTNISSNIRLYLSRIAAALESPDNSDQVIEAGKEHMQEQAGEVKDLNNTLDSVPKDDIDIDSILGDSLSFNPTGLGFLATVTNNKYVTAVLSLVFTFALIGYIFFGKR